MIPKEPFRSLTNKRVPKITFKAQSFEYDEKTEVHTVQVSGIQLISLTYS